MLDFSDDKIFIFSNHEKQEKIYYFRKQSLFYLNIIIIINEKYLFNLIKYLFKYIVNILMSETKGEK